MATEKIIEMEIITLPGGGKIVRNKKPAAEIVAGLDYYNPRTWSGAVRCVDCICDQYGERSFGELDTMPEAYDAGRPVSEGNARLGLPADTCNECDTCSRPVCRGMVCGACGFAPGCKEHDEGHAAGCAEAAQ